jgi:hypothetical protein
MLRRGVRRSHPSFIWLMFVLLFFSWIAAEIAFRWIGPVNEAVIWFIPAYVFADLSPCIFVLFVLSYTRGFHAMERSHLWVAAVILLPKVTSVVRSSFLVVNFNGDWNGVDQGLGECPHWGFGYCAFQDSSQIILGADWYLFGLAGTMGLYLVGALLLFFPPEDKRTPAYRREIRYIGGGMAALFLVGLPPDIIAPLVQEHVPSFSSVAILIMNFVIALGITRRGVLLFSAVTEHVEGVRGSADVQVEGGRIYVLGRDRARETFKHLVNQGFEGLYVGVGEPDPDVAGSFKRTPVIVIEKHGWGVREEGNIRYVPSNNLRGLSDSILHYARTARKGVIYLDLIDEIFDERWINARAALEIGGELGAPRAGMPKITWLYSVERDTGDPVELPSLFDMPIVKKAMLVHLFNAVIERSQQPQLELGRRLSTLQSIDPFFAHIELRPDGVQISQRVGEDVDLLKLDVTNKVRIFFKQFEDRMPASARAEVLRKIAGMGLPPYAFIVRGGDAYLLQESAGTRGRGYEIMKELVRYGYLGLCISRTEPTKLAEKYAFEPGTLVYWLTAERRGDKDLRPAPEYVVNQVKSFVEEAEDRNGIILLDGLEFLITYSGDQFDAYLKALRRISDLVAQSRTVFVVVYDAEVFPPDRVALIRRSGFELLPAQVDRS